MHGSISKMSTKRAWVAAGALFAVCLAGGADAARLKTAVGEITSRTETAPDSVTIGQRFHIRYHFTFDADSLRPLVPQKLNAGTCRVMGVTYTESKPEKDKKNVERIADVTFIPLSIDSSVVPANKFDFLAGNGDTIRTWTDDVRVPIKRIAAHAKDLNPLKEQWKAPPNYFLWGAIALGVLAAIAAVIWWIRKKRRSVVETPAVRLPPEVIALAELDRIAALGLPARGDYKQHYTLLVDALRHYLEARYGIEAMDRTTFELMDDLDRHRVHVDGLRPLLDEADLVKFAKFAPSPENASGAINRAREMVMHTTPVTAAPDILAPSEPSEPSSPVAGAS
jgi:hypothetical protein